ncbi:MAG: hypothetical protein ACYTFY_12475 [Planctomycetota bacterium]|jgi:hypothetical protein
MLWDENTLVMIDHNIIEEENNISMVREEPEKHPANPLLSLDDKAITLNGAMDGMQIQMLVKDGSIWRLWYLALGVQQSMFGKNKNNSKAWGKESFTAYAESKDGLKFKPVMLNQIKSPDGKKTNLLDMFSKVKGKARACGFFHDPLDKEYPFKCLYYRPGKGKDMNKSLLLTFPSHKDRDWYFIWGIGKSKDGLNWEPPTHKHNMVKANPEHAWLHRALDGGLVMADQMMSAADDWGYRNVKGWVTYDNEHAEEIPGYVYSVPQHMVRLQASYTGPVWQGTPWIQPHVGLRCIRKGPSIIAMHGYLYGAAGNNGAETFAQHADVGLSIGNGGARFIDVWPFIPFIRRGHKGTWDFGMARQADIVETKDETRFYYIGNTVGNFAGNYQSGMAFLPKDRYGYRMISGYRDRKIGKTKGSFKLKSVTLPEKVSISVNCSHVKSRRYIKLELRDKKGKVIPGYSFKNCTPVTKEGLSRKVTWKSKTGKELAGKDVVIGVEIHSEDCDIVVHDSPRIYSLYTGSK